MTPVRMQPIEFLPTTTDGDGVFAIPVLPSCCPPEIFSQKVFPNDIINFQFILPPCLGVENTILNPAFTDGTEFVQANWLVGPSDFPGFWVEFDANGALMKFNASSIEQSNVAIVAGDYYLLQIRVFVNSTNGIAGSVLNVLGFEELISFSAITGLHSFYVRALPGETIKIFQSDWIPNESTRPHIGEVILSRIEIPDIVVTDVHGTTIAAGTPSFDFAPPFFNVNYQAVDEAVDLGCFRLVLYRDCEAPFISEAFEVIPVDFCHIYIGQCDNSNIHDGQLYGRFEAFVVNDQKPEIDKFATRDSKGRYRMNYSNMVRVFSLYIEAIPAHKRDFINWLAASNTVAIKLNGQPTEEYFVINEPEAPEFADKDYGLAPMKLSIVHKEELNEHIYRGDCQVFLPPLILGERKTNIAIKAGTDTVIEVK